MYTKKQELLLNKFADLSDELFRLGITTTDSFTGEIGEYVACMHFKLNKTKKVTRAIDGVCSLGHNYQIKAKVIASTNFTCNISNLETSSFDYLVIVFFNTEYCPIKIVRIPSKKIKDNSIRITSALMNSGIEVIEKSQIKLPIKSKLAINDFAKAFQELEVAGIIRSRRVVGDIGEFYACRRLGLDICCNKTERGIDARDKRGRTYEIKTRRIYESGRRESKVRRLNNLVGKCADFLIVVVIDRSFKCAGMWLMPTKNVINPQSAKLQIVNTTPGTINLIPSTIPWLNSGKPLEEKNTKKSKSLKIKSPIKPINTIRRKATINSVSKNKVPHYIHTKTHRNNIGGITWIIIIAFLILVIGELLFR